MNIRKITTFAIGLIFFVVLSGNRGCTPGEVAVGAFVAGAVVASAVDHNDGYVYVDSVAVYTGDVALTIYTPLNTTYFTVTVREGGAFGPVVLQARDFAVDANGVGFLDIGGLSYGFYDIEIVGLSPYGTTASYATRGLMVDVPYINIAVDLQPVTW